MITAPTILFQSPNRIGLGHLNRLASIAVTLQSLFQRVRTPFVIEGASHSFLERYALPFLTIPSSLELAESAEWACWSESERVRLMTGLSDAILESWKPQLVVYDCLPSRHFSLAVSRKGIPSAFCIREVKSFESYAEDPRVKAAISEAEVLIVPHRSTTFSLPRQLVNKTVYVGDIIRPKGLTIAKSAWGIGASQRLVIVTGGGGGHSRTVEYYNTVLRSLEAVMQRHDDLYVLLVTGPLFREWGRLSLPARVHVIPFEPELDNLFSRAHLVISQAGYNSTAELAALGVPTICLPQHRAFDNQFKRAEEFSRENDNFQVYRRKDSGDLTSLIERCLENRFVGDNPISTRRADGALLAAKVLMNLLER